MKCLNNEKLARLHSFSPKRWMFCAFFTLFLLLGILVLPFWNFHVTSQVTEGISENAVSVVKVMPRRKIKKVEKAVQKPPVPKSESIQTAPKAPPEKTEEEQTPEEIEETADSEEEIFSDNTEDSVQKETAGEFSENQIISEEVVKATASYRSYALSRIAGKKQYPASARSKGYEGKVRISAVINPDGTLSECTILTPCDYEILNEACLKALKKASPFKKMPAGMSAMTLTFMMEFSLR